MPVVIASKTGTILVHYDGREGGQRDWRNVLLGLRVLPGDGIRRNTAAQRQRGHHSKKYVALLVQISLV